MQGFELAHPNILFISGVNEGVGPTEPWQKDLPDSEQPQDVPDEKWFIIGSPQKTSMVLKTPICAA